MQAYFEGYAQAFVDRDWAQIERHFAYPCLLADRAGVDVIHGADELDQHLQGFLAMLAERGVSAIGADVRAHTQPDAAHATAHVAYALQDDLGQTLETFAFLYVLVKGRAGDWKIRLAEWLGP